MNDTAADATTASASRGRSAPPGLPADLPSDRGEALLVVFGMFEHVQGVPDHEANRALLERWAEQARAAGWLDVRAHVLHGLLVDDLFAGAAPDRLRARADAFRDAAEESGDEILLARALGGRLTFLGVSDADGLGDRAGDLEDRPGDRARAVALLLLPVAGSGRCERRLTTLVDRVRRQDWPRSADGLQVTVSIGSAVGPAHDVDDLLRTADGNLYRAKAAGRDRLVG